MWWGLYKRRGKSPIFTAAWDEHEVWVSRPPKRLRKYRDLDTAKRKAEALAPAIDDDEVIELWEHNEWNMPVKFLGNYTKMKS
jgi:hypothetical protein